MRISQLFSSPGLWPSCNSTHYITTAKNVLYNVDLITDNRRLALNILYVTTNPLADCPNWSKILKHMSRETVPEIMASHANCRCTSQKMKLANGYIPESIVGRMEY